MEKQKGLQREILELIGPGYSKGKLLDILNLIRWMKLLPLPKVGEDIRKF